MSGTQLKWLAILSMIIDHTGAVLFPQYIVFRWVGRLAFPIFCFLLVEGYTYTHSFNKYLLRLFIFALISEVPFDLAFWGKALYLGHQNVFFSLALGLLMMRVFERVSAKNRWAGYAIVYLFGLIGEILAFDYGFFGILLIFSIYLAKSMKQKALMILILNLVYGFLNKLDGYSAYQILAGISGIFPLLYDGSRQHTDYSQLKTKSKVLYLIGDNKRGKYIFYVIYPLHLLVLYVLYPLI